jgi:hypothetical protein
LKGKTERTEDEDDDEYEDENKTRNASNPYYDD